MKNQGIQFLIIAWGIYCPFALSQPIKPVTTTQYITETKEDIEELLVNFPERVPSGPEIYTLRGRQISPGSLPRDFRINKQIYNDIAELQIQINSLIQTVLSLAYQPERLSKAQLEIRDLLEMFANAGIRYNMKREFDIKQERLIDIRNDLEKPNTYDKIANPYNFYLTIRFQLETIMAEIENALKQVKVVGQYNL